MKVVEGNFGKADEKDNRTLREKLLDRLETAGVLEATDTDFSMFVQDGSRILLLTTEDSMADVFYFVDMFKSKYYNNEGY